MAKADPESQAVRFASRDWIWLIVVIAGASVANMGALHQISSNLSEDMIELDLRWQQRTTQLAKDIEQDLNDIKGQIPPDWFRKMVEENKTDLRRQEERLDRIELILARQYGIDDE